MRLLKGQFSAGDGLSCGERKAELGESVVRNFYSNFTDGLCLAHVKIEDLYWLAFLLNFPVISFFITFYKIMYFY